MKFSLNENLSKANNSEDGFIKTAINSRTGRFSKATVISKGGRRWVFYQRINSVFRS